MPDISKELNNIMNARYGKDVRQSIHDGIMKLNDNLEDAGVDELLDVRNGADGELYNSAGDAVRNQYWQLNDEAGYKFLGFYDLSGKKDFLIPFTFEKNKAYSLFAKNLSALSGYFEGYSILNAKNSLQFTKLIEANSSMWVNLEPVSVNLQSVYLRNTNTRTLKVYVFENLSKTQDILTSSINRKIQYFDGGYIDTIGNVNPGDGIYTAPVPVKEGDMFVYSGGYASSSYNMIYGYKSDGSLVDETLLENGYYLNQKVVIPNGIDYIRAWGGTKQPFILKYVENLTNISLGNDDAFGIEGFNLNHNSTASILSSSNRAIKAQFIQTSGIVQFLSNKQIPSGTFAFVRFRVKANKKCQLYLSFWPIKTKQTTSIYDLDAEKWTEIYYRSQNTDTQGSVNFNIEVRNIAEQVDIEIEKIAICLNSYNAWIDLEDLLTLKDYSKPDLIVSKNEDGHFKSLNEACTFAKKAWDVNSQDVIIHVKAGQYYEPPTNAYPYAAVNKGANKISIIGEDKEVCIVYTINTSEVQSKVIDIGGPCTVSGLTIKSLKDSSYTKENDMNHNCYAIHNDSGFSTSEKYTTLVKDCILYSEGHSPLGAGLHQYQTQKYENVVSIFNGIITGQGAFYIHASSNPTDTDMAVILDNCTGITYVDNFGINLPDVVGSLPYSKISTTIRRCVAASALNPDMPTNVSKEHNKLTIDSALNNVESMNY